MIDIFTQNGFEGVEAKIYLHLLKKGPLSQQFISNQTGILRQTVYEVMAKMEQKGYVATTLIGKRKQYSAVDPKNILNQIREKERDFAHILPKLNELKLSPNAEIQSSTFIGLRGLKNAFELTLDSQSNLLWMANKEISDKIFKGYYWQNYGLRRKEQKVAIKLLIEPAEKTDWNSDKSALRVTKMNSFVKNLDASYVVFDDTVITYSLKEDQLVGVLIKSQAIADSHKKWFETLWKNSKLI